MKNISFSLMTVVLATGLVACDDDNSLTITRSAQSPMTVDLASLPVNFYRTEKVWEQDYSCGSHAVFLGRGVAYPITNFCWVTRDVLDHQENLNLRIVFPAGSALTDSQTERVQGHFWNQGKQGFVDIKIRSRFHNYNSDALTAIPVSAGAWNEIRIQLQQ